MAQPETPKRGKGSTRESYLGVRANHMPVAFFHWHLHLKLLVSWLILFFLLSHSYSASGLDVEGEALVEILKSLNDSDHRLTDWSPFLVSPCYSWSHVTCRDGHVISLSLGSIGLSGTLSPSITKLKFLVSLDLHDNNLSGELPDYLGSMLHLQNLNFARNHLNGSIPTSWGQLSKLKHLVIRGNHLSEYIPDSLANITDLMEVWNCTEFLFTSVTAVKMDISSNNLTGRIPTQLFSVPVFNFTGTRLACGTSFQEPCISSSSLPAGSTRKSKLKVVITGVSCGAFFLLLLAAIFMYKFHRVHELKRDVFVDVAGIVGLSFVIVFSMRS